MKLIVDYSLEKDARTYVDFVYTFKSYEHGRQGIKDTLLKKLDPQLQAVIASATSEEDAYKKVYDYLEKYQQDNSQKIENSIAKLREEWEFVGEAIIRSLEFLYQNKFPFEEVTACLTTNRIFPYNYKERYFFVSSEYLTSQLATAKHELNHFMFYYYYPELKEQLGDEEYELLKESLTFFSNPEQRGKPNEQPLRDLYKSKIWTSFNEAVKAGAVLLAE